MPLDSAGLQDDLEALAESPGDTIADCAQQWASAMQAYAAGVVPPSTQVSTAASALQTALTGAFASVDPVTTAASMEAAFAAFAVTVGAGMAPDFVATPPAGSAGFATLFAASPKPATHAAAAASFGGSIDAWMRTGTVTPSGGGAPTPWS